MAKVPMEVDQGSMGTRHVVMDFPSNSHKQKEAQKSEKKVERITKEPVIQRKKSLGRKIQETFCANDISTVVRSVFTTVAIPAILDLLSDTITGAVDMMLYGELRNRRKYGHKNYTNYSKYSDSNKTSDRRVVTVQKDIEDIVFMSRAEAEEVRDKMIDVLEEFGVVSVADLYEMVGITGSFADNNVGWTNLKGSKVVRDRDGKYILLLPRVVSLD